MNSDDKIEIIKAIGELKTEIAVRNERDTFYHTMVKAHNKLLMGNGMRWGIKNQKTYQRFI